MMTAIRERMTLSNRDEVGGISAEFVAVLIIVAALIAAIWNSGIDQKVSDCATKAEQRLFTKSANVDC
ncbi:MAG: hypothetical protein KG028_00140 [Actinobacteria bacterium]|jgi:hypothetical protein|nr:hypothetical protein [Actinomycetota bacterium]